MLFRTIVLLASIVFMLTSCGTWQAVKAGINNYGGTYEQEKLSTAEFGLCVQPAIAAVQFRYTGAHLVAYQNFCNFKTEDAIRSDDHEATRD